MKGRVLALLAAFAATLIYGVNYTIAKEVMPLYIKPYGFILIRVIGAFILFWLLGFLVKNQKIAKRDYVAIFFAAVCGAALNMLAFFKGLSLTTPINASVIMVTVPIIVFVLSVFFLKEKLIRHRVIGVIIGLIGALVLIIYGKSTANNASNIFLGNVYIFINATIYAFYLIIIKKLIDKYHPIVLMKWTYSIGLLIVIPFGYNEMVSIELSTMPTLVIYKILFVALTTFFAYLFNILALTKLKPTTIAAFIYLQPVIATIFALLLESDELNPVKLVASVIIFIGVYLVSKRAKQAI